MSQSVHATGALESSARAADSSLFRTGLLVINADDWGRDRETTDRILACVQFGSVSAVSSMVFMEDSERAAELACSSDMDAGLHLNLTSQFTAGNCDPRLTNHHHRVIRYLRSSRIARYVVNPFLRSSFEYVVRAQIDEYKRLYGAAPVRIDGHHHVHLSANVQWQRLLPSGTHVRRNFSFTPGEKGRVNRLFRSRQDRRLARRHHLDDLFFLLPPLEPIGRVERLVSYATDHTVELETHPVNTDEFEFLTSPQLPALMERFHLPFPMASAKVRYSAEASPSSSA